MTTKSASLIFGLAFIAVGILGFIPNPLIGDSEDAIFHADTLHNIVHVVSGSLMLLIPLAKTGVTASFLKGFGVIYLLIGVLGLINIGSEGMGSVLGFLHVNGPDNFLHIGLGLLIFLAGFLPQIPRVRN
jgi:hypothetical protein